MTDKVQKTPEEIEQDAFSEGFKDESAATGGTQPEPQQPEDEAAPIAPKETIEASPEAKPQAKKPAEQKPKDEFVRLTKADFESLKTNAGKVPELEKRLETAFGKFGPLTQMINELKAATPKGQAVELPADVVSELEAEFPELAGGVKSALTKALKGLIGTGKNDSAPEDVIKARLEDWAVNRAAEDLEEDHPKWREIVGAVAKGQQPDAAHPFRAWLATQPEEYRDKINNTMNPTVIANAITKFQTSRREVVKPAVTIKPAVKVQTAKPSKQVLLRKNRIQGSVQPKGFGAPPIPQKQTAEDAFDEGYRSG